MLKISEIYPAIQGETSFSGEPCTIVRLAECNLNCKWCDTPQAMEVKEELSVEEVFERCSKQGLELVLITGGEPLLQKDAFKLMQSLVEGGFKVLVETNGSLPLEGIPPEVIAILDWKCPGSGMESRMLPQNLGKIRPCDELKFIICDQRDFNHAITVVKDHDLTKKCKVMFSPEFNTMKADILAKWILETRLPIRLNIQMHKYIWNNEQEQI